MGSQTIQKIPFVIIIQECLLAVAPHSNHMAKRVGCIDSGLSWDVF